MPQYSATLDQGTTSTYFMVVRQMCSSPGEAKNTCGAGCFMLLNTGHQIVSSKTGPSTTVG